MPLVALFLVSRPAASLAQASGLYPLPLPSVGAKAIPVAPGQRTFRVPLGFERVLRFLQPIPLLSGFDSCRSRLEPRLTRDFGGSHGDPNGPRASAREFLGFFPPRFAEGKSGLPFETRTENHTGFRRLLRRAERGARSLSRDYSGVFLRGSRKGKPGSRVRSSEEPLRA